MQNNGLRELIVFMECDGLHIRKGKVLTASIAAKFSAFFLFVSSHHLEQALGHRERSRRQQGDENQHPFHAGQGTQRGHRQSTVAQCEDDGRKE